MRCQQDAVYRAQTVLPNQPRFRDLDELETWLHVELLDTYWWHERFPLVRGIEVSTVLRRNGEGSVGSWHPDDGVGFVEFSTAHLNGRTLCHEVAHVTSAAEGSQAHCPLFVRHYLELVYRALGQDAWLALRRSFLDEGVEIG